MTPYKLVDESPKTTVAANAVLDHSGGYADNGESVRPEVIVGHPLPHSTSGLQNLDIQANQTFINVGAAKSCCSPGTLCITILILFGAWLLIKVFVICFFYKCTSRY